MIKQGSSKHLFKVALAIILIFSPLAAFAQATGASAGTDAIQMLINLNKSFPALWKMVTGLCYILGFVLTIRGIYYLKAYGELRTMASTQTSLKVPIVFFIAASALIYIPSTLQVILQTGFGYDSPLSYTDVTTSIDPIILQAIVAIVQFVGLVAFVRGWMIIVGNAQQQGGGHHSFGKGITHIIGGIFAMNILGVMDVIWNTFGFTF